jgi:tetratricopeptide (TPR) repeat protein
VTLEQTNDGAGCEQEQPARAHLAEAMAAHGRGEIDVACAAAREAIALCPTLAAAHAYLGNTLVTRQRRFADGLAALERATELTPRDATTWYTLGWCREYAAHALSRSRRNRQPPGVDAPTLYAAAREALLRARSLDPDAALLGDVEDMLDVVASATGEPWDEALVARAAPRSRGAASTSGRG